MKIKLLSAFFLIHFIHTHSYISHKKLNNNYLTEIIHFLHFSLKELSQIVIKLFCTVISKQFPVNFAPYVGQILARYIEQYRYF